MDTVMLRSELMNAAFIQLSFWNFLPRGVESTWPSFLGERSSYILPWESSKKKSLDADSGRPSSPMGVGQKRPWNAMLCTVNAHLALRYLPVDVHEDRDVTGGGSKVSDGVR